MQPTAGAELSPRSRRLFAFLPSLNQIKSLHCRSLHSFRQLSQGTPPRTTLFKSPPLKNTQTSPQISQHSSDEPNPSPPLGPPPSVAPPCQAPVPHLPSRLPQQRQRGTPRPRAAPPGRALRRLGAGLCSAHPIMALRRPALLLLLPLLGECRASGMDPEIFRKVFGVGGDAGRMRRSGGKGMR